MLNGSFCSNTCFILKSISPLFVINLYKDLLVNFPELSKAHTKVSSSSEISADSRSFMRFVHYSTSSDPSLLLRSNCQSSLCISATDTSCFLHILKSLGKLILRGQLCSQTSCQNLTLTPLPIFQLVPLSYQPLTPSRPFQN